MGLKVINPTIIKNACNETRKQNVAAYARVSFDSLEQLHSFEAQNDHYSEHIKSNPKWNFVGVYADEAITGTNVFKRVEFKRMIADCKAGKIDIILVKSISRFGRNTTDILKYVRMLKDLGIAVIYELENINTMEVSGELLLTILSALAQDQSKSISDNVKWGNDKAFRKGQVYGNSIILGYKVIDGELHIVEEQAKIVRFIYSQYLEGYGSHLIAKKLTNDGVPTPTQFHVREMKENGRVTKFKSTAKEWNATTVLQILDNEKYAGHLLTQKYYTVDFLSHKRLKNKGELKKYFWENHHEPIVSVEVWDAVQLERARRAKLQNAEKGRKNKHSNKYAWSGRIKCGQCGESYRRNIWHKGKAYENVNWQCLGYSLKGKDYCDAGSISEKVLNEIVLLSLKEIQSDKKYIMNKHMEYLEKQLTEEGYEREIFNVETQLTQLLEEAKELRKMKRRKEITDAEYKTDYEEMQETQVKLQDVLNELNAKQSHMTNKTARLEKLRQFLDTKLDTGEFNEDMIRTMVEKIVTFGKTHYEIYFFGNVQVDVDKPDDAFISTMRGGAPLKAPAMT